MSKSTLSKSTATTGALPAAHAFHTAFTKTAAARAALPPGDLMPINLDVQLATTTVLGALPRLATFRDAIVAELPAFDIARFDKLRTYAEALTHAHGAYLAASEPLEPLPALVAQAAEVRDQLLSDATALARRGFVDGKRLAELKGSVGYLNICSDLNVLVRMLRERWTDIATKSAIQPAELDEAERLYERITLAYAERAQPSTVATAASDDRQRAFTLLVQAYDQARRAVAFLRWDEEDADKITPSLWAGRGGRPAAAGAGTSAGDRMPAGADGGGATATGSHASTPVNASTGTPAPAAVTPGHPGGSPFADS